MSGEVILMGREKTLDRFSMHYIITFQYRLGYAGTVFVAHHASMSGEAFLGERAFV